MKNDNIKKMVWSPVRSIPKPKPNVRGTVSVSGVSKT